MTASPKTIPSSQAEAPFFVGVDVGGTNIKIGVVDNRGRPLSHLSIKTDVPQGPEEGMRRTGEAVRQAITAAGLAADQVAYCGLGSPGTQDLPRGMLLEPPNLPGWENFPIRDRLSAHCGLPVAYANDANSAAYGEFWVGSGRELHSLVLLTLGTGVGGGIIIGDMNVEGEHSHGSECGHIIIDFNDTARMCSCGRRGHLEAYCSARAVVRRVQEALWSGRASTLRARIATGEELTTLVVAEDAERGDGLALEIVLDTARYLAVGVTSLVHTIDPAGVILGGAMTWGGAEHPLGRRFLTELRTEVHRLTFPTLAGRTIIDYASLGGDAGYIGAAGIGRLAYLKSRSP